MTCRPAVLPGLLLLAAAASSGCLVLSLQPAYDAASVVYDEALVGRWENPVDETVATIERAQWRSYKVTYTDRFATRTFHGNLTKIGSATYLDLTEIRGADAGPYLLPVHGVYRLRVSHDSLAAAPLDYGWLTGAVAKNMLDRLVAALDDRRNFVVTSSTGELRQWLARAPDAAFSAAITFTRRK